MLNLVLRAMRGGCSNQVSFEVSFETASGYRWLQFTPMMLIFELTMAQLDRKRRRRQMWQDRVATL